MDDQAYRLAARIELYDAQIIIQASEPESVRGLSTTDQLLGFKVSGQWSATLQKETRYYGDDLEDLAVGAVFARIDGPHLLSILVVEESYDEQYAREFVYCGTFSVEWAEEAVFSDNFPSSLTHTDETTPSDDDAGDEPVELPTSYNLYITDEPDEQDQTVHETPVQEETLPATPPKKKPRKRQVGVKLA